MTKEQHIAYWNELSTEDIETAVYNFVGNKNVACLFFLHLSVEKKLKAIWVKDNFSNTPPHIHDLQKIASETNIQLLAEQYDLMTIVNSWNIATRYPDYKKTIYAIATIEYTQQQIDKTKDLLQCLQSYL